MNYFINKMKKNIAFILVLLVAFSAVVPTHTEAAAYTIYVSGVKTTYTGVKWNVQYEGKKVNLSNTPGLTIKGTGMVPYYKTLVAGGPKMGYKLDSDTYALTLTYGNKTLVVNNNSRTAYLNGEKKTLSQAPCRVKYASTGQTLFMVPIKSICELMDLNYSYTTKTSTINISKKKTSTPAPTNSTEHVSNSSNVQAKQLKGLSTSKFIQKLGPIAKADYQRTGVLASVTLAQAILESGWAKSDLAVSANNLFGMKTSLSGNNWSGSAWDGKSKYTKRTAEYGGSGKYYITAAFRKYANVEQSIADHSAYLTHAKNGSKLRYAGLTSTKSYTKQLQIIKKGGYATSGSYVSQLTKVIRTYHLDKWD